MAINKELLKKQIEKAKKQQGGKLTESQKRTAKKYLGSSPSAPSTTTPTPSTGGSGANQDILQRQIEKAREQQGGELTPDQIEDANKLGAGIEPTNEIADEVANEEVAPSTREEVAPNPAIMDRVRELAQLQNQQRLSQIQEAKQKALGTLEQEQEGIEPAFSEARRETRAGARRSARNFDEYLAQRGLSQSGAGAEAQIRQTQTTQRQLGQLGQQEAQAIQDIERRRQQVQQGALSDVERSRLAQQEAVLQGTLGLAQQQQQQDFQREMADTQFDQRVALDKINDTQRRELEKISSQNQIKYLEKQDELIRSRQSGDLSPVELYRRKMEIDQEYGVGDFADEYKDDYSVIMAGIENRYNNDNYAGAYSAYVRNKAVADALLDKNIIEDLNQYRANIEESQRTNLGGRPVR